MGVHIIKLGTCLVTFKLGILSAKLVVRKRLPVSYILCLVHALINALINTLINALVKDNL
jgi:hypothetical protein